jgi:hypothetical protein
MSRFLKMNQEHGLCGGILNLRTRTDEALAKKVIFRAVVTSSSHSDKANEDNDDCGML